MQDTAVNDSVFGVRKLILIDFNNQYALMIIILFTTEMQNLNLTVAPFFYSILELFFWHFSAMTRITDISVTVHHQRHVI